MEGEQIWLAPPEYVILRKLEFYREGGSDKHLRDIAGILELSSQDLNLARLHEMVRTHRLLEEWEKVKKPQGSPVEAGW